MAVESREEAQAEDVAWREFMAAAVNHHTPAAFRAGWLAGRDWARSQDQAIVEAARAYREACATNGGDWQTAQEHLFDAIDGAAEEGS